jgi:hypothetical protein
MKGHIQKTVLLIAMIIFICKSIDAQINIKAGIVQSNVSYDGVKNTDVFKSALKPQFIGVYYQLKPINIIGLETGLQYVGINQASNIISVPDIKNN